MDLNELNATAQCARRAGQGILAADESSGTIKKRFDSIGVESTEDQPPRLPRDAVHHQGRGRPHQRRDPLRRDDPPVGRRRHAAREAARGPGDHPRHQGRRRREAARVRARARRVTEGLDGLRERLAEYRELGARFAKWRATYIDHRRAAVRRTASTSNAHALARYAALCQEAGIVPIVEPEVLMDGRPHDRALLRRHDGGAASACSTRCTSSACAFEGTLLKPNMVLPGYDSPKQASDEDSRGSDGPLLPAKPCPPRSPASCSCRAGRADEQATAHLNAINQLGPHPWQLSLLVRPRAPGGRA